MTSPSSVTGTRTALLLGVVALLSTGCVTSLGPRAVGERPNYNQQILRSANAEMLLNIVRLRYNDSPLFLELGTVVASYSLNGSFDASGFIPASGTNTANLGAAVAYGENPTLSYTPLGGEDFAERMLAPIYTGVGGSTLPMTTRARSIGSAC